MNCAISRENIGEGHTILSLIISVLGIENPVFFLIFAYAYILSTI